MKKVLMASPSKAFLGRNTALLMNQGFRFFTASSGSEALKLHAELEFDLILSELELNDMDSCDLCSQIHQKDDLKSLPVIIICHDKVQHLQRVKQSNAAAILLRPINPTHLLITIGSFIDMQLARSKRVGLNTAVLIKKQGAELACDSRDISATGIRLVTEHKLDLGARISCRFALPEICQIQADAEVVRYNDASNGRNKNVYGARFIDLPMSHRNAIAKYVASNNHLGIKQKMYRPLEKSMNYQLSPA